MASTLIQELTHEVLSTVQQTENNIIRLFAPEGRTNTWIRHEEISEFLKAQTYRFLTYDGEPLVREKIQNYLNDHGIDGYSTSTLNNIQKKIEVKQFLQESFDSYTDYPTKINLCHNMNKLITWGQTGQDETHKIIFKKRLYDVWSRVLDDKRRIGKIGEDAGLKDFEKHSNPVFAPEALDEAGQLFNFSIFHGTQTVPLETYYEFAPLSNEEKQFAADVIERKGADVEVDVEADVEADVEVDVEADVEVDVESDVEVDVEVDVEADVIERNATVTPSVSIGSTVTANGQVPNDTSRPQSPVFIDDPSDESIEQQEAEQLAIIATGNEMITKALEKLVKIKSVQLKRLSRV